MTLENYIYAFLALLVFAVLWVVVLHIVTEKIVGRESPQTYETDSDLEMQALRILDDFEADKARDAHVDQLLEKWEQSRKNA